MDNKRELHNNENIRKSNVRRYAGNSVNSNTRKKIKKGDSGKVKRPSDSARTNSAKPNSARIKNQANSKSSNVRRRPLNNDFDIQNQNIKKAGERKLSKKEKQARMEARAKASRKNQSMETIKRREMKARLRAERAANRPVIFISYVFLLIFVAMIVYLIRFQIKDSESVINSPYNNRDKVLSTSIIRGSIVDRNGNVLAKTVVADDESETRSYPYGNLFCHSVGYSTRGTSGIEGMMNYRLLTSNAPVDEIALNELNGKKNMGDTVVTTLDANLTNAAYTALGDYNGAVIMIEPSTGKILCEVSKPDFDPNTVADNYEAIIADSTNSSLLNRATNGLYTPGSTFKLFTLTEYLNENPTSYMDYYFKCTSTFEYQGSKIGCSSGIAHGSEDLTSSFANSCNGSFANIGLSLDITSFKALCTQMYFNSELPVDIDYKKSQFKLDENSTNFDIMQTSIGQGETLVTPLHLCMIASSIANDGKLMKPYIVSEIDNYLGTRVKYFEQKEVGNLFSKDQTDLLKTFLRAVVTSGTAKKLNGSDLYTAYGKTGTAQVKNGSENNGLFMGFAENEAGRKVAICIVMENAGDGISPVVPVAREILDAYYNIQ